jgi:hypothetical protein
MPLTPALAGRWILGTRPRMTLAEVPENYAPACRTK